MGLIRFIVCPFQPHMAEVLGTIYQVADSVPVDRKFFYSKALFQKLFHSIYFAKFLKCIISAQLCVQSPVSYVQS